MIVLPMAGLSKRFFDAGYIAPKYMLTIHGRSVFSHAIGSFKAFFGQERFLIICRDFYDTPAFVRTECAAIGLAPSQFDLVALAASTGGQAETVAVGLTAAVCDRDEALTIFNIDTFRPGFRHPESYDVTAVDGYIEVFRGEGAHWSFVRPLESDREGCRVAEVTEKIRISDLCSTGLYYFRTADMFLELYRGIANKDPAELQGGERYIAPLYNDALMHGADIRYALIEASEVQFCGTPHEYIALGGSPA